MLFLLTLTGGAVVHARFPLRLGVPSFAIGMIAGTVTWLAAVAVASFALAELRKHRTPVEPGQRPTALVTSGVFAFTRNPLYLSLLLVATGLAFAVDALWLAISATLLWLLLDRAVILDEERLLEETFGDEYIAYTRRTRRWL